MKQETKERNSVNNDLTAKGMKNSFQRRKHNNS
jgi:hypothetical protein